MKDFLDKHKAPDTVAFGVALDNDTDARIAVAAFLNDLELIALMYTWDVGDKDLLSRFFQDIFISYYKRSSFYIRVRREKANFENIFDTFEAVVKDWSNKKGVKLKELNYSLLQHLCDTKINIMKQMQSGGDTHI